ncbi:AraC-type DNA-binding protein [Fodinibius salinus]|uniref:AraC-type DNA-binding protein n=1 Tax=Fodinibius salinus TaxID=860790 RepID=A0A5D3YFD8_9BACT|nr:AraC family transcriptional regulator [Fodinibius salinus]TYP91746.1 AraC-type DNA-binding protein [Fodinibius salinus]
MQEEQNTVELQQQFFPISDFHTIMDKWSDLLDHNPTKNIYTADNDYHSFTFSYQLLGDDVLILHQKTHCYAKHRMELLPRHEGKFYTLKYLLNQNKSARLISGDDHYDMYQSTIALFSNYANYVTELPAGYHEENLQIVISHNFIDQYINKQHISHPRLQKIIDEPNDLMFLLPQAPSPIKSKIKQLAQTVGDPSSTPTNKLQILTHISNTLDMLFQLQIENPMEPSSLPVNVAQQVAEYLDDYLKMPFPGMDFLAAQFGISVSGLKRHFKQEMNTTPFRYYRHKQMQLAQKKLQGTKTTVSEVAYQLGFDNASNFIRAFKAEFDITPGRYQQQYSTE